MKYPCADGIDRDEAIDLYVALRKQEKELRQQVATLTAQWESVRYQMGRLTFDKLGFCGLKAVPEEKQNAGR
jgi:hypothetical protein